MDFFLGGPLSGSTAVELSKKKEKIAQLSPSG
jgi:hypothetical protein